MHDARERAIALDKVRKQISLLEQKIETRGRRFGIELGLELGLGSGGGRRVGGRTIVAIVGEGARQLREIKTGNRVEPGGPSEYAILIACYTGLSDYGRRQNRRAKSGARAQKGQTKVSAEKIRHLGLEVDIVNRRVGLPCKEGARKENFTIEKTIGELVGEQCTGRTMSRCDFERLEESGMMMRGEKKRAGDR